MDSTLNIESIYNECKFIWGDNSLPPIHDILIRWSRDMNTVACATEYRGCRIPQYVIEISWFYIVALRELVSKRSFMVYYRDIVAHEFCHISQSHNERKMNHDAWFNRRMKWLNAHRGPYIRVEQNIFLHGSGSTILDLDMLVKKKGYNNEKVPGGIICVRRNIEGIFDQYQV